VGLPRQLRFTVALIGCMLLVRSVPSCVALLRHGWAWRAAAVALLQPAAAAVCFWVAFRAPRRSPGGVPFVRPGVLFVAAGLGLLVTGFAADRGEWAFALGEECLLLGVGMCLVAWLIRHFHGAGRQA